MKRLKVTAVLVGLLLVVASTASAADTEDESGWHYDRGLHYNSESGRFEFNVHNRLQFRAISGDPELGSGFHSFDIARYKIHGSGTAFGEWVFGVQVDLANGSETSELLLEDIWVKFVRQALAQLWLGQGKVQFGRQFLTDSGRLQFVDRSIAAMRFTHAEENGVASIRDVGVALIGEAEKYGYSVGFYNGNGVNKDVDDNQDYMVVGHLVVTPLGPLPLGESDPESTDRSARLALGVSVMTNNQRAVESERVNTGAAEVAFRVAGFSFNGEFFTQNEDILGGVPLDEVETDGWYAQAGYLFAVGEIARLEIAGRVSEILNDTPGTDVEEVGAAVSLYLQGHDKKLVADYRDIDFEMPVFGETDTKEFRFQFQAVF